MTITEPDGWNIVSDLLSLHGMRDQPGRNRTDAYTLLLAYDGSEFTGEAEASLALAAFVENDGSDSDPGEWQLVAEATLGEAAEAPLMRAPQPGDPVGSWGIDTVNDQVWARLDYQGDFAITAQIVDSDGDGLDDTWEQDKLGTLDYNGSYDPDGDGLDNAQEQAYGTDPLLADTDGDLIGDAEEVQNGLDPLSADIGLSQSVINTLHRNPDRQASTGLYPREPLGQLGMGTPLIEVNESGVVELSIQLLHAPDLDSEMSPIGTPIEISLPAPDEKQFYQWEAN